MEYDSPDFVPSIFTYKKKGMRPESKLERFKRRVDREERASSRPAPMAQPAGESVAGPCPADDSMVGDGTEGANQMVPKKEYDSLKKQYDCLNLDYGHLRQEYYALQDQNKQLKEELQHSKFSYLSVKNCAAQFLFFTGLTTIIFEW